MNKAERKKMIWLTKTGFSLLMVFVLAAMVFGVALAEGEDPPTPEATHQYFVGVEETMTDGMVVERGIIGGPPEPPLGFERNIVTEVGSNESGSLVQLTVPYSTWAFGCSATSASMIAGYYDQNGYDNMYTGPTNGGVFPANNSSWGTWVDGSGATRALNPLSATKAGLDGRVAKGSVDDYWVSYGTEGPHDPWYGSWTEHTYADAVGDFMKTNQWDHGYLNSDGSTSIYTWSDSPSQLTCAQMEGYGIHTQDGTYGVKLFYESRGYIVTDCYAQRTDNNQAGGFSFADYMAEIDAGHPVMFHVTGHTMVGTGYNTTGNLVYLNDTWDHSTHSMTWGGSYAGMTMYAVSIVHVDFPPVLLTPTNGTIFTNNASPTFTWEETPGATWYQFYLQEDGGSNILTQWYEVGDGVSCASDICSLDPGVSLWNGDYTWSVQPWTGVAGTWYDAFTVQVDAPVPGLTNPADGATVTVSAPDFRWDETGGATWYLFKADIQGGSNYMTKWYQVGNGVSCSGGECSFDSPPALPNDTYDWTVQPWSSGAGSGTWYGTFTVQVDAPVPELSNPTDGATVTVSTPDFRWDETGGATWYYFKATNSGGVATISKWYQVGNGVSCSGGSCGLDNDPALSNDTYTWTIQPWSSSAGSGAWYGAFTLTVNAPMPDLISPADGETLTTSSRATYQWEEQAGATWYYLKVTNSSGTNAILKWYQVGNGVTCNAGTCTVYPDIPLADGAYTWTVQSWGSGAGSGSWYAPFDLNVDLMSMWTVYNGNWWIEGGDYLYTEAPYYEWNSVSYTNNTYTDFEYSATMWRNSSEGWSSGILLRGTPTPLSLENAWNSAYGFYYSKCGYFSIWKWDAPVDSDGYTAIQEWTYSSAIVSGGNTLRVTANGSTLTFYINGTPVWSGTDTTFSAGKVGVTMYADGTSDEKLWVGDAGISGSVAALADQVDAAQLALNQEANQDGSTGSPTQCLECLTENE